MLSKHPKLKEVLPYLKIETYSKDGLSEPRFRIEVIPGAPRRFLNIVSVCPACGSAMHPIRERQGKNKRSSSHHYYVAASCRELGCSRGKAAHEEYLRLKSAILFRPMSQLKLPGL